MVDAAFAAVQDRLAAAWLADRPGSPVERTVVALPSYSLDPLILSHFAARILALEQRFLYGILLLADPHRRLVYVSSVAPPAYLVDYFLGFLDRRIRADARSRLTLLTVDDASSRPLSAKVLERPEVLDRLRRLTAGRSAMLEPWNVTALETELAVRVGLPLDGADPSLWALATKSGGRRLFADEGVPHPLGAEVRTTGDLEQAILRMRADRPRLTGVVVKLDDSASGDGNAVLDLSGIADEGTEAAVRLVLEGLPGWYVEALAADGGIVEERIAGDDFRSPSVQLSVTPLGEVLVLSTHDQVLGGENGQVYQGCAFPADPGYATDITAHARTIGARLAREGVVGRFAIDFAVARDAGSEWRPYAVEINLRKTGTTHPFSTARLLTGGVYDESAVSLRTATGAHRCYLATDNLVDPSWTTLDGSEVIAAIAAAGLAWDPVDERGVVLHMLSCLPVDGRFGFTAIAATPAEAAELYRRAEETVRALAARRVPAALAR
jgi:hypothetical protein